MKVKCRVTLVREDGRVNLAMTQLKQVGRNEDADKLLAFMKERPMGGMPYSDATPPDIIKRPLASVSLPSSVPWAN